MGALSLGGDGSTIASADDDTCLSGNPVQNNPANRPSGTLIRNPIDGAIYRLEGCYKRHIATQQDLDSHRVSHAYPSTWGNAGC